MGWGAIIQMALGIVSSITTGMDAKREAKFNSAQTKRDTGAAVNADLDDSARAIGRAVTLAGASGGGLTGSALSVVEDLSRQGMARARSIAYTGVSQARAIAMGASVAEAAMAAGAVRSVTPLLTEWSRSPQWSPGGGDAGGAPSGGNGTSSAMGSGFSTRAGTGG